jgi:L-fucose isomerase-like protein
LKQWLKRGKVKQDMSHVRKYDKQDAPRDAASVGKAFAKQLRADKAIIGVFDEGCMGMYNAIIPDELLHPIGVYKERLSQSALVAKMKSVSDAEARAVYEWLLAVGMKFHFGPNEATDLTAAQVLNQCKMYVAAVRMADEFGCAAIGIQYQQGLKDMTCASDLVEGMLNNVDRPQVTREGTKEILYAGNALPHFNEVDECAALDALVINGLWRRLGYAPETTLHDLRWGRHFSGEGVDDFVWVLEISGAAPPEHFIDGWRGAVGERQPPMYFPLGGSTLKGVSKPGWVVWSRVFVADGRLNYDTGLAEVVKLPQEETEERWRMTSPQWPLMHAVLQGITRDQMMARHKSNHIQVVYAPNKKGARYGLYAKAAAMKELGLKVSICGKV